MKLKDVADEIVIDPRKLTDYALDELSPPGSHKALLFKLKLGLTLDDAAYIIEQLEHSALDASVQARERDRYGQRYRADLWMTGKKGQRAIVRTGWIIRAGERVARLTTIYVRKENG